MYIPRLLIGAAVVSQYFDIFPVCVSMDCAHIDKQVLTCS
jgi:hypothetical protein